MKLNFLQNCDQFETSLYGLVQYRTGAYVDIANMTGAKPAMLSQSLNPDNPERPSFVTRTALFFTAWIYLNPRKGIEAFCLFVSFVMQAIPDAGTLRKLTTIKGELQAVKRDIEEVNQAIETMPEIRTWARGTVRKRREGIKRIKQPTI
jgi:hypothetical protein